MADTPQPQDGVRGTAARPWCCPEPRCTPLTHVANGDISQFESGESWWCWGVLDRPVTFSYDGNEHTNDFNSCFYSPLKGVIRSQENEDDWRVLRRCYTWLVEHGLPKARALQDDRPCVMQPADDCSAVLPCADCPEDSRG